MTSRTGLSTHRGRRLARTIRSRLRSAGSLRTSGQQRWDLKWQTTGRFAWQADEVAPELADAVASGWIPPGSSVLDLGCGDGVNAAWLAQRGFEVHGIDIAATAVERARERSGHIPGLTFAVADVSLADSLGDRTFDVLVDRGCLSNIPERLRPDYAANVAAWARSGTPFLLSLLGRPEKGRAVERLLSGAFDCETTSTVPAMASAEGITRDGLVFRLRRRP